MSELGDFEPDPKSVVWDSAWRLEQGRGRRVYAKALVVFATLVAGAAGATKVQFWDLGAGEVTTPVFLRVALGQLGFAAVPGLLVAGFAKRCLGPGLPWGLVAMPIGAGLLWAGRFAGAFGLLPELGFLAGALVGFIAPRLLRPAAAGHGVWGLAVVLVAASFTLQRIPPTWVGSADVAGWMSLGGLCFGAALGARGRLIGPAGRSPG